MTFLNLQFTIYSRPRTRSSSTTSSTPSTYSATASRLSLSTKSATTPRSVTTPPRDSMASRSAYAVVLLSARSASRTRALISSSELVQLDILIILGPIGIVGNQVGLVDICARQLAQMINILGVEHRALVGRKALARHLVAFLFGRYIRPVERGVGRRIAAGPPRRRRALATSFGHISTLLSKHVPDHGVARSVPAKWRRYATAL